MDLREKTDLPYRFHRCGTVRSDGARCWRPPHADGRHICLRPGVVPSPASIQAIADLHPRADAPQVIMLMAALEPVGKATPEGMKQASALLRGPGLAR